MLQQFWGPHPQWTMDLSDFLFRAVFRGTAVLLYLLLFLQIILNKYSIIYTIDTYIQNYT